MLHLSIRVRVLPLLWTLTFSSLFSLRCLDACDASFCVELGYGKCKSSGEKFEKGEVRVGVIHGNGVQYYKLRVMEDFLKQMQSTLVNDEEMKAISYEDFDGFEELSVADAAVVGSAFQSLKQVSKGKRSGGRSQGTKRSSQESKDDTQGKQKQTPQRSSKRTKTDTHVKMEKVAEKVAEERTSEDSSPKIAQEQNADKSAYEKMREERIRLNQQRMQELNLQGEVSLLLCIC